MKKLILSILLIQLPASYGLAQRQRSSNLKQKVQNQKQNAQDYDQFKNSVDSTYNSFRDKANEQYASFMEKVWKEYKVEDAVERPIEEEIQPIEYNKEKDTIYLMEKKRLEEEDKLVQEKKKREEEERKLIELQKQQDQQQKQLAEEMEKQQQEQQRLAEEQQKQQQEQQRLTEEKEKQLQEQQQLAEEREKQKLQQQRLAEEKQKQQKERERLIAEKGKQEKQQQQLQADQKKQQEELQKIAEMKKLQEQEQLRLQEEKKKLEEQLRQLADLRKQQEEQQKKFEAQKKKEELLKLQAEKKKKEEEQKALAERQKQQEEQQRMLDQQQKKQEEQIKLLEEQKKKQEEQQRLIAEEKKKQDEQLKLIEAKQKKQQEEEQLFAEKKKKQDEQLKLLEEKQEKQQKEEQLLAEKKKKQEEQQRLLAENKKQHEEQLRLLEEKKKQQEEQQRLLAKKKKQQEEQQRLLAEQKKKQQEEQSKPIEAVVIPIKEDPKPQPKPIEPIQENKEAVTTSSFAYYGTPIDIRWGNAKNFKLNGTTTKDFANGYRDLSQKGYTNLLHDCLKIRDTYKLCDWAYYKMLQALSETTCGKGTNEAVFLQGYLFHQSGYQMRFATEPDTHKLHLLTKISGTPYNCGYTIIDGKLFFLMDGCKSKNLSICEASYPGEQEMNLIINELPTLKQDMSDLRTIISRFVMVEAQAKVNKNILNFFEEYPSSYDGQNMMSRWAYYANAPLSDETKEILYPQLKKQIANKSKLEAANLLLNWIQMGLQYAYDDKIWGHDRAFFAEESLFYPYCDCEDRSILYSHLIRELLGLDVVLVYYPGHLYTAVAFDDSHVTGDYIMVNGRKFTVADPTFYNANVGKTMSRMDNTKAQVILLNRL